MPRNKPIAGPVKQQLRPQRGRGESIQGPHQDAKGGNAGANQGGAPRGGSRLEPSHRRDPKKKNR